MATKTGLGSARSTAGPGGANEFTRTTIETVKKGLYDNGADYRGDFTPSMFAAIIEAADFGDALGPSALEAEYKGAQDSFGLPGAMRSDDEQPTNQELAGIR